MKVPFCSFFFFFRYLTYDYKINWELLFLNTLTPLQKVALLVGPRVLAPSAGGCSEGCVALTLSEVLAHRGCWARGALLCEARCIHKDGKVRVGEARQVSLHAAPFLTQSHPPDSEPQRAACARTSGSPCNTTLEQGGNVVEMLFPVWSGEEMC